MSTYLEFGALLLQELQSKGVTVDMDDYGVFAARINGFEIQLMLDRLYADYVQNKDANRVAAFVDQLHSASHRFALWENARPRIFYMVESSDLEFGRAINHNISQQLRSTLVLLFRENIGLVLLTPKHVSQWGQSVATVHQQATQNLSAQAEKTKFHVQEFDRFRLGMFITESPLKASFVFCSNLKDIVEPVLGWPVLAAVPCRDFAYLIPENDSEMLPRLRPVIISEYLHSGYPLSTEIILMSDAGAKVVKRFGADFPDEEYEDGQ